MGGEGTTPGPQALPSTLTIASIPRITPEFYFEHVHIICLLIKEIAQKLNLLFNFNDLESFSHFGYCQIIR